MIIIKTLLKYLGFYAIFLVFIILVCSLINLVGINSTITNLILFIFNALLFFIFGLKSGKNASSKGYLAGLKVSGLFLLVLIILNLISNRLSFNILSLLYYIILIFAGVLGGMMGINKKEATK